VVLRPGSRNESEVEKDRSKIIDVYWFRVVRIFVQTQLQRNVPLHSDKIMQLDDYRNDRKWMSEAGINKFTGLIFYRMKLTKKHRFLQYHWISTFNISLTDTRILV